MIDLAFVESLIRALDASNLDSLELERGGTRIRLSKSQPAPSYSMERTGLVPWAPGGGPAVSVPAPAETLPVPTSLAASGEPSKAQKGLLEVKSPMVGTFYRSPAPDASPYVEVGHKVGPGTVLCIIEAMKLMNELESEVSGTIAQILVENAQPVEYGQVLFVIDPS